MAGKVKGRLTENELLVLGNNVPFETFILPIDRFCFGKIVTFGTVFVFAFQTKRGGPIGPPPFSRVGKFSGQCGHVSEAKFVGLAQHPVHEQTEDAEDRIVTHVGRHGPSHVGPVALG